MKALLALLLSAAVPGSVAAQAPAPQGRPLSWGEALDIAEKESETVGIARAEVARAEGDRRRLIDFAKWSHEKGTPLREALI